MGSHGTLLRMDIAVIGFVIAILGIILQIADAFPEHRETRKAIVLLTIGIFLGILTSAVLGVQYSITGNVDRRFALLYGLAGVAALFALTAIAVVDAKRREVALALAASAAGLFLVSGFVVGLSSVEPAERYSNDEILLLANDAEQRGRFDLAIERLEELNRRVRDDQASKILEGRISKIQDMQRGIFTSASK